MASFSFWKPAGFWQPSLSPFWAFESPLPLISFPVWKNFVDLIAIATPLYDLTTKCGLTCAFRWCFKLDEILLHFQHLSNLNYIEIKLL